MLFRVLGAVGAQRGADAVTLGGPKPRALLAALLLAEGRVLPVSRLISVIWDDDPPESAPALLHTYVSALRRACGPGAGSIVTEPPGYRIDLTGCTLDYQEFTRLAKQAAAASAAGDHETAAGAGRAALAHWQGPALSGLKSNFAAAESARLADLRLAVTEDVFDAELAMSRGASLVDDLRTLVAEHPLRERLRCQLMTALWSAGRQADALGVYRDGRRLLVEDLGVEPGPELRATHERMLRGGRSRTAAVAGDAEPATGPCLLPHDISDFTGRGTEARQITGTAARIVAVSGKPGSGKSSLAVHAAHRLRPRFPDGQLYVDLRGARETPVEPVAVLGRFLRALGVPDAELPAELDERVELYRMVTARRRLLVVLDDAAGERQVRPLLPSGPDCLCVITSRVRPAALEAAEHLGLGVLGDDDCLTLLARIVGAERLDREPEQARMLVHLCGNLPLAVRIAGARLAARPDWPPSRLVPRLQEQRKSLNELAIGDLEVRGSLALSYHSLDEPQRTALRRLGWLGVPDFAAWLVCALLEVTPDDAEDVVEALVRAQLLDVVSTEATAPARYRLHDLTRVFAWERAETEEDHDVLRAAVDRATGEWHRLVEWASGGSPTRPRHPRAIDRAPAAGLVSTAALGDPQAWFDTEQTALVHVVERAGELGLADAAVRLAAALCASSFAVENRFHHWWRTHTAALAAARLANDLCGQGLLLSGLGLLRAEQDRYDEAADYYREALAAYSEIDDPAGESIVRVLLSGVHREQGKLTDALDLLDSALPVLAATDDVATAAQARHWRGMVLTELGRLDESLADFDLALAGYRSLPDEHGVALVVRSIGITHRAAGRLAAAEEMCARALEALRDTGDRLMSAYAVQSLAKVHIRLGNRPWDQVHAMLTEALETCHGMQDGFGQALMLRTLGELEIARNRPDAARRRLEHALTWCDALAVPLWRARTLRDLAVALESLGLPAEAGRTHAEAMALFVACDSREAREPRLPAPRRQPAEDRPGP